MAKKTKQHTDGLGPEELKKISSAIRTVWQRSYARRLCVKRCSLPDEYFKCDGCGHTVPKIHVDHIKPAGSIRDSDFIQRLFCPSSRLQGLCKACHKPKTAAERAWRKKQAVSALS